MSTVPAWHFRTKTKILAIGEKRQMSRYFSFIHSFSFTPAISLGRITGTVIEEIYKCLAVRKFRMVLWTPHQARVEL